LIELLVVIAILALLVSLLLPSLERARRLARGTVCLSLLKALATANQMYAEEYDDYTVPMMTRNWTRYWSCNTGFQRLLNITAANDVPANSQGLPWADPYWPGRMLCPSSGAFDWPSNNPDASGFYRAGLSWGMNANGLYVSRDSSNYQQYVVRRAQMLELANPAESRPSDKVFMLDGLNEEIDGGSHADPGGYDTYGEKPITVGQKYVGYRHLGSANVAFQDGHAAPATPDFLWNGGNASTTRTVWKLKQVATQN